jgi:hypothetical protein
VDQSPPSNLGLQEAARCAEIQGALQEATAIEDPLFRELALDRLARLRDEARGLAAGEIVFLNTETWRSAYEKLLTELNFSTYYSVAWVRTADYWRDQAGRRSIRLNYELLDRGLSIERMLILPEPLWSTRSAAPSDSIRIWIEEQHYRGITLSLIRQSDLFRDSDLISDFGIYGQRATGEQELDEQSRTIRFLLTFGDAAVQRARARWDRIKVFSVPCLQVLDLN